MDAREVAENDHVYFWIEYGFLNQAYKKDAVIGLVAAQQSVELRKKFVKGVHYCALVFIKNIKVISPEARQYLAGEESCEGIIKLALVTDSVFTKIMGNAFMVIDKPRTPTRLFTDKKDAIEWLKKK